MNEQNIDRRNFDVVSISQPGKAKKKNYVQNAMFLAGIEKTSGQFVKVFADIIRTKTGGKGALK